MTCCNLKFSDIGYNFLSGEFRGTEKLIYYNSSHTHILFFPQSHKECLVLKSIVIFFFCHLVSLCKTLLRYVLNKKSHPIPDGLYKGFTVLSEIKSNPQKESSAIASHLHCIPCSACFCIISPVFSPFNHAKIWMCVKNIISSDKGGEMFH